MNRAFIMISRIHPDCVLLAVLVCLLLWGVQW